MEVSKELLSEVLGINNISSISYDINFPNIIEHNQYATLARGRRSTEINIYEFASKCKEWAFNEGYQLEISRYWNIPTYYCKLVIRGGDFCEECGESRAIYELEDLQEIDIVVKACEYILKEINENK